MVNVSGRNWKLEHQPLDKGIKTTWETRQRMRMLETQAKAKEREMKSEKESEHQAKIEKIKARRAIKEERERFRKMAETMHRKRVERARRRELRKRMRRQRADECENK